MVGLKRPLGEKERETERDSIVTHTTLSEVIISHGHDGERERETGR